MGSLHTHTNSIPPSAFFPHKAANDKAANVVNRLSLQWPLPIVIAIVIVITINFLQEDSVNVI